MQLQVVIEYVVVSCIVTCSGFDSMHSYECLINEVLHLLKWSLPWGTVYTLNYTKILSLLNVFEYHVLNSYCSWAIDAHHYTLVFVYTHELCSGKDV